MRQLRLRMPDDSIKSVTVDENQPVANLMVIVCTKLGITNHDEYSLIATGAQTLNGRRKETRQDGRIIDQKMEQLKKKLKTDEDLAWVDHSKTLDEQEIHEQDVVLLRRRFFYSDQNVDSKDPLQLGLLYVQTRDAILSGTHPVTLDGACKFAGLQCQAQLGDFVEGKTTRPGYFQLKDYLPTDYSKVKHIERKIFAEQKKYYGLSELEAKSKYVGEARSLPTYGVTFFLVKEKVPGKNKLVPRLLGITKDCVMRVDADSKAILKTWPLTTVKRWAASMNSFTLDFGDYSDSYYSVQTSEGEQISQLIAGYIDIILKRRKAKDHFGIEGDEGATMIEDSVAPSRATIIQNQPALTRPPSAAPSQIDLSSVAGPNVEKMKFEEGPVVEPPEFRPAVEVRGKAEIGYESRPITQYVTNYELSLPQRDLQDRLEQAQDAVEEAQKVLDTSTPQQHHNLSGGSGGQQRVGGSQQVRYEPREVEQKKRRLSNQFAEINAATAQLVSLSAIPEEELNYPALNSAVETVASSLPTVAKDVKIVASHMEDEESGERLIDATRRLSKAFGDLLNAAEPGPTVPRQSLISAASRVGDATQTLLYTINDGEEGEEEERELADELLALAKTVASSAAALVLKAKDVASTCRQEEAQNMVIGSATQCALATSQMVATAKIVAPTIHDPACQRKLLDACREVQRAVDGIQGACRQAIRDQDLLCLVDAAVDRVNKALDALMDHVRNVKRSSNSRQTTSSSTTKTTKTTTTHHKIHDENSGRLYDSTGDNNKNLARATAQLIQATRPEDRQQLRQQHFESRERLNQYNQNDHQDDEAYEQQEQNVISNSRHSQYQNNNQSSYGDQIPVPVSTTTTITTTVYDETFGNTGASHLQTGGGHHLREPRPVSMYESEEQQLHNQSSFVNRQQHYTESSSSSNHLIQQQQQQQQQSIQPDDSSNPEAAISGIVGDLETSIMFATAGTLRAPNNDHDGYLYHRENVLRCAKALVEDTRPLVASAASDQQQLAQAAQESVFTMSRLADTVKASAASLGPNNADSQVNLIRSVKDVAVSLADLIGSTKSALGCDPNDPRLMYVKDSAKTMVTSVTSLLRTVKSVEDEQQRGIRAIEAALEAIEQELAHYNSQCAHDDPAQQKSMRCPPEELVRATRPVTMATAKTVHAGSSGAQDDAIVASNMGRKAIIDLLHASRSSSYNAESHELRSRVQEAGRSCALNYKHLIELLHKIFQHPSVAAANPEVKQELINQSKNVATCVSELVSCSELLRHSNSSSQTTTSTTITSTTSQQQQQQQQQHLHQGTSQVSSSSNQQNQQQQHNWESASQYDHLASASNRLAGYPDDPTVIAESELLGAASSIDAAARKLENLKPRVTSVKPYDL